jgi:2-dehydro-3-deoxyphosphogluconate aldolase / (4S)-4-hydroxy-2-oxoglutarate aldolase
MYRWELMTRLTEQRVFGIVRTADADTALQAAEAVLDAGLHAVEITLTSPGALDVIERLAARPDVLVGAGTVLDTPSARLALLAGARFLVSPSLHPEVIRTAHRYGAAAIPGTGSPTEIVAALEAGADGVKLYPAAALGPRWLARVREPLPQAPLIPTGGITVEDVPDWIAAGAVACGIGSGLTAGGPEEARKRVAELLGRLGTT